MSKNTNNDITERTNEWVEINFDIKYVNKLRQMSNKNRELTYQLIPAGTSRVNVVTDFEPEINTPFPEFGINKRKKILTWCMHWQMVWLTTVGIKKFKQTC